MQAVFVGDHDLTGLDIAHELGADDVQRAGFRRDDPGVAEPAEDQRAHAQRVARADEFAPG